MNASGNRRGHFGFQLQMIAYTLASMFLTALTLLVIGFAVYGVLVLVQDNPDLAVPGEDKGYYKEYLNRIENVEDLSGIAAANSGMVEFSVRPEKSHVLKKGTVFALSGLAIFLALFFFSLYFLLFTRKFAAYLAEITVGIRRFAAGEPGARIVVRQANELTQIAESFNAMAEELEEIETEEKKNEGAKNDLITSIAHDLRTPLTSVIGYLELVTEKDVDEETRRHYISVAYRKAKRLQCLTDDLFNYIKYGSSELTLTLAPIDAIKMMEQLTEEAYPAISENRLELVLEKELDRAVVEADGTLLARAFSNLLGNAIKYGRDGKRLFLQMGQETPETVSFHIINFGEVIPTEDLERIFERFYRVDAARTEEQGGTGLGLAIAKNIIERHGGTISVKSDLSGTEFIVVLPLAPVKGDEI
ncbi:MAG: HAMP domain-containing sensor histidine kinase [Lachnospiraceae bacterium]|nr:HAMP domain-containing histidine kinase [Lachnospiraceae bacterium]MCX4347683.1 HAMP domain-containing sensor histidine kinase [Lachnospiraceae bacterium]